MSRLPERIVCLTEETTETLYLLGEDARIVGISGFTVRPPKARREKPRVSAFTSAKIDKILALRPDLVLGFSDLQADIAAELIRNGIEVHVYNHRTIEGIFAMIHSLGAMVGASARTRLLLGELQAGLDAVRERSRRRERRPRVYFEEWDEPQISAIGWVSELIEVAGGDDCFVELSRQSLGRNRIIADPQEVVRRRPEVILGSWCGKRFAADRVVERPGWAEVPAVRDGALYEIKSAMILQPGPAALTDGVRAIERALDDWSARVRG